LERDGSSVVGRGLAGYELLMIGVERNKTSSNKLVKVLHLVG